MVSTGWPITNTLRHLNTQIPTSSANRSCTGIGVPFDLLSIPLGGTNLNGNLFGGAYRSVGTNLRDLQFYLDSERQKLWPRGR